VPFSPRRPRQRRLRPVGPTVGDAEVKNVLPREAVIRINREVVIEAARRYLGVL